MTDTRLVSVLVPAVGGQGGGVLAEWIVEAATVEGLVAHGTSIPGVAQRTGSTTYYVEIFSGPAGEEPAFSLYPVPGALDVLLAPEFMEVGRAIELGFPTADRTTIVASTHRLYSIHEKMATGRNTYPQEDLERAARASSRDLLAFDALAVAREQGTEVNAVLLGALAATGVLPIGVDAFRAAIERKGIQVEANLRGFEVGSDIGRRRVPPEPAPTKRAPRIPEQFVEALAAFPAEVRPVIGEALARMLDYQDDHYATLFLDRLEFFVGPGRPPQLIEAVARQLALWMTYEDAVRVADLKTRAARFARIRQEAGTADGELVVVDYLKPDLDELYGILPYRLVRPFARWAERRWPRGRPTVTQHVTSTSIFGFLLLRLMARLRRFRPISYRAQVEQERIERWLTAVRQCADWDSELAVEAARAAQLVRGYGEVRRRMLGTFDQLLQALLQAAALEAVTGGGFAVSRGLAATCRRLALQGPDDEARAGVLAADVLAKLHANDPAAALLVLKSAT
jgi:indolepyruvate ferredoxin oxidoreductase beta subunit